MRLIRITVVGLVFAVAAAPMACTQQGSTAEKGGETRGQEKHELLFKGIELSTQQRAAIDSVTAKYRADLRALREAGVLDEATRERKREIVEGQEADVRALLTPEQRAIYDRNMATMRKRAGQRPSGPQG